MVREHRVGSSPTSGTEEALQKGAKSATSAGPRRSAVSIPASRTATTTTSTSSWLMPHEYRTSLAAPDEIRRRGLHPASFLRTGACSEWGRGRELEGASESAPHPLRYFGRFQTGERVLRAGLREPPVSRTSPSANYFAQTAFREVRLTTSNTDITHLGDALSSERS